MKLEKNNLYIDKYCWRCRAFNPKYDIRINLRAESFYEGMRIPLNGLYYLIYNCFINQYTINRSYNEMEKFTNLMKMQKVSKKLIITIYRKLRKKIKDFYHDIWSNTMLGSEPDDSGKSRIEIDENKIIGNANTVIWMFGLIDRVDKQARVYCIMNDRTKNTLLNIIKNNVYTTGPFCDEDFKTRIYSDCFSSYQTSDFQALGFKLNKVNHSI